jgi:hypothetical protein
MFVVEVYMFALTLMYAGELEKNLEIPRRCVHNHVLAPRYFWTAANVIRGDWGAVCASGGLVSRVSEGGRA